MASLPPHPPLDFGTVLSESKRIINAHSRHFLALSVLFLLPLSFSTTIYPTLHHLLAYPDPNNPKIVLRFTLSDSQPIASSAANTRTLSLALAYALFVFLFSLCAAGSITYSVFHGFYGRPVKLGSAVRSVFNSFLPLLATALISQIFVSLICIAFGIFVFLVIRGIQLLGYQVDYNSFYFSGFCLAVLIILVSGLICLQVNWGLACVVVVVESTWGFGPLRRSARLVKGMRRIALCLVMFFGILGSIVVWSSSLSAATLGGGSNGYGWKSWAFVVQIVVISALVTLLMLYSFAASTVLYMYCKAVHGELAVQIAEDYVTLPFHYQKLPNGVYV